MPDKDIEGELYSAVVIKSVLALKIAAIETAIRSKKKPYQLMPYDYKVTG